jgi:hypothetical protein
LQNVTKLNAIGSRNPPALPEVSYVGLGSEVRAHSALESGLDTRDKPTLAAAALLHLKRMAAICAADDHLIEQVNGRFSSLIGCLGQARFPSFFWVIVAHPGHASLRSLVDAMMAPLHAYVGSAVESPA